MLPDILNYIPDPKNGRPIAGGQVYFFKGGYLPPTNAKDIDPAFIAPVTYVGQAGEITVPQPMFTSKGGVIKVSSEINLPLLNADPSTELVAIYDKCGSLVYRVGYHRDGRLAVVSETDPQFNLTQGSRWYKPSEATTYIYYCDVDSCQWLQEPVASAVTGATGLSGKVSVEQYGASVDATPEENYTAIMAALTENAGKNIVFFPAIYEVSATILIPSNSQLEGVNWDVSGIRGADTMPRHEPLVLTGHRLVKGNNITIRNMLVDFNRNRWTVDSGTSSSWQDLTVEKNGPTSNREVSRTALLICNSENVLVQNVWSKDGWNHGIDVAAPWYGRGTTGPSRAVQYDPNPSKWVVLDGCRVTGAGDDNITTHQSSYIWIKNCRSYDSSGVVVPGNSNAFEIDDGSRYVWVENCVGYRCRTGLQIKGHADSPAPYNVYVDNCLFYNNRYNLETSHTGWTGDFSAVTSETPPENPSLNDRWYKQSTGILSQWNGSVWVAAEEPLLDEDGNPVILSGPSETARNVFISNTICAAPRGTNFPNATDNRAARNVRIREYENVVVTNMICHDGTIELAGVYDEVLPAESIRNNPVVQISNGATKVSFKNLVIRGFSTTALGGAVRIFGTAGVGINFDGIYVDQGPSVGLYQTGSTTVSVNNYFMRAAADAPRVEGLESVAVRLSSIVNSYVGSGESYNYDFSVRFGGRLFSDDVSGTHKRAFFRRGVDVLCENGLNFGVDVKRAGSNGRMLRLYRDEQIPSSFFFSTDSGTSYSTWLATGKGTSGVPQVVLGYCNQLNQPALTKTLIGSGSIIDNISLSEIESLELTVGSIVSISIPSISVNVSLPVVFISSSNNGLGGRTIVVDGDIFNGAFNATGTIKNLSAGSALVTPELFGSRVAMFVAEENTGGVHTLRPSGDSTNTKNLGDPRTNMRWTEIFATNGTINTSDAREKTAVSAMTSDEINAAKQLAQEIGTYKFLSAIAEKGDAARTHIGMTVQRAIEIMEANNLVATDYSFICHDVWDEQPAESEKDPVTGEMVEYLPAKPAGDIYSFRYDELNMFIARGFEARLSALEEQLNNG